MELTPEEQREMYNTVIKIGEGCKSCKETQCQHGARLTIVERFMWIFGGVGLALKFIFK